MPPVARAFDKLARIATAVLLLAGVAAFVRGWLYSDMFAKIPWQVEGAQRAALLSFAYWLVFVAIVATGRRALGGKLVTAMLLALAAAAGVVPLLAVVLIVFAATALGYGLLFRGRPPPLDTSELPLCSALGLGIFAAVLAALGVWPINTQFTYFVLLALPVAWTGSPVVRLLLAGARRTFDLRWRELLLLGATGNALLLHAAMAVLPEVGNDALAFHLLIAAHVHDTGAWHYDVQRNVLAVSPLGVTFLYAAGYMFAGEMAARLVNFATLAALLWLVFATVRPLAGRVHSQLATLVVAVSPLAFVESASLFVDNGWSLLVVASLVAMLQFAKGGDERRLIAGGIAYGASLTAKLISAAAFPAALVLLLLALKDRKARFPWGALALAVIAGLLVALPPYVIALVKTGNPVFPFFNAVFQSPLYPAHNAPPYPPSLDPLLLYRMTFYSDRYFEGVPGSLGFTLLLLAPALLVAAFAWGRREASTMMFAAVAFAVVVVANVAYLRYLYPVAFMVAIAFGTTLSRLPQDARWLRHAFVAAAVLGVVANLAFLPAGWRPGHAFPLAEIVDKQARSAYVAAWAHPRLVVPLLNALPEQEAGVAFVGSPPFFAQLRRPGYAVTPYTRIFERRFGHVRTREDLLTIIRDFDLSYFLLDARHERQWRTLIASVSSPLATFESSTLYRVRSQDRYTVELVKGDGMIVGDGAWIPIGTVGPLESGAAIVNHDRALYQRVPVAGGRRYRYAVEAKCHDAPADVRLQVIWHFPEGETEVSWRSAACSAAWQEDEAVFQAPAGAVAAVVFAIAHTNEDVAIRRVSFRGEP